MGKAAFLFINERNLPFHKNDKFFDSKEFDWNRSIHELKFFVHVVTSIKHFIASSAAN